MSSNEYYAIVNERFDENFSILKKMGFTRTMLTGDDGAKAYLMVRRGEYPKQTVSIPTAVLGFMTTDRLLDYYGIR